ncbi:related to KIP1 - kinesin-related protein [Melanopsichium pennsylvanicum]|uniref:Related to KIP1 - kinesin-related protein n=2 Tax=Melanopsichium pennsylvanicum TaxID=63383 RepID=A0AAJ5C880_9BASI|nr:related to KIP1-kinesin-related protein [Melanopsichium pennsylvanicum 4]SNX87707.1 related to KIP1 - kinesin-related protein [Melanopsichium pennsylvanicum]
MSALRRQPSSSNLVRPAQPRSRAPSVAPPISSSGAARRLTVNSSQSAPRPPSSASSNDANNKRSDATESNIQVVVRVRGQAPNEPNKTETGIITTSGPRSQQIDVAIEPAPVSSSSLLTCSSSLVQESSTRQKSYHFDQVFGPEADQGMVYQDVVGPILEEVMSGYNCTIFAYGQTGTGKTHTMEGDLTSQMGTYSSEAGIIPRSLYRLFHTLELSKEDYSVKATFIELYNEELRDLLSLESSTESFPSAHKDSQQHNLRMYDDARGKGVVIQGLEEVALKDAAHGLTVLQRGSQKRQIAATNCNEQSSRSHSVFTMTVFIKDKGSRGEDVLKIGKLNLVDLAGSENIGRSGAQNGRAREAGMINQSLLTLGRVINALVEKSSHIPYRESKLTRLLQESLGGRTKTCIIATISQERANIEETLSTLDYALRAKSIKNRPELNTRMTRSALIKEYVFEIERLKGDLQASRDQNGIYLTDESWKTMHNEHEERKTLAETLKRNAEVTESKLSSLKEQFEQNMQLLVKRDNEVKVAKAECADKVAELEALIAKATSLELTIEEEVALRKAYMASEAHLNQAAASLAELVHQSTADVQALFDKLERKTTVEKANRTLVAECRNAVSQRAIELETSLINFHSAEGEFHASLKSNLDSLVKGTETRHDEQQQFLQARLKKVSNSLREVRSGQMESKDVLSALLGDLDSTIQEMQASSESSLGSLKQTCRGAINDVVLANTQRFAQVAVSMKQMVQSHVASLRDVREINEMNQGKLAEVKAAAEAASNQEISRLREQNAILTATVDEMKRSNICLKSDLMADFGRLLDRFTEKQESAVSTSIASAQNLVSRSTEASESHASEQRNQLDSICLATNEMACHLERSQTSLVSQSSEIAKDVTEASDELGHKMDAFASAIEDDLSASTVNASRVHEEISGLTSKTREEIESRTKAQSAKIKSTNTKLTETLESITSNLEASSCEVGSAARQVVESVDERQAEVRVWGEQIGQGLKGLCCDSNTLLASKFKEDKSTGQTPQKRVWKMPGRWKLVPSNREDAIQAGRKVVDTLVVSTVTTASDDLMSSEVGFEALSEPEDVQITDVAPDSADASIDKVAQIRAETPIEVQEKPIKTRSTRPLRELAFDHSNLPTSTCNNDKSNNHSIKTNVFNESSSLSKSRNLPKNKLELLPPSTLPMSKRARS